MSRGECKEGLGERLVNIAGDIITGIGGQSGSLVQRVFWVEPLGCPPKHSLATASTGMARAQPTSSLASEALMGRGL